MRLYHNFDSRQAQGFNFSVSFLFFCMKLKLKLNILFLLKRITFIKNYSNKYYFFHFENLFGDNFLAKFFANN